ncbi:MAG: hypothetical protein WC879_03370 [Melioribacteraceae bacterium]
MLQSFFIIRTGSENFSAGMVDGDGVSFIAETDAEGNIIVGIEADFVRTRNGANNNDLMPGTQGISGFSFVAPVGQVKKLDYY